MNIEMIKRKKDSRTVYMPLLIRLSSQLRNDYFLNNSRKKIEKESDLELLVSKCLKKLGVGHELEVRLGYEIPIRTVLLMNKCTSYLKIGSRYYASVRADILISNDTVLELKCLKIITPKNMDSLSNQMSYYQRCVGIKKVYGIVYESCSDEIYIKKIRGSSLINYDVVSV